jgi:hypothetical protein
MRISKFIASSVERTALCTPVSQNSWKINSAVYTSRTDDDSDRTINVDITDRNSFTLLRKLYPP